MERRFRLPILTLSALLILALLQIDAQASVIPVGIAAFPAGPPAVDFSNLADGTEVNGLTVNGFMFSYVVGGSPLNGSVIIDGGPGTTNNIMPPNIVSTPTGNITGTLFVSLPGFVDTFGYGYAILTTQTVANATTISVFNDAVNLGTLSYVGTPDPVFAGGFAGIQSTVFFNRVGISFNSAAASAFALDNIRVATVIPEPSGIVLVASGLAALSILRRIKAKAGSVCA